MARVDLVCFDWGGVILKHCRSWAEGCAAAGIDFRPGVEHNDLVIQRRAVHHDFQIGAITAPEFYQRIVKATGNRYTTDEVRIIHDAWLTEEYEGMNSVILRLHGMRVRTGLLSNTNETHWARHIARPDGSAADFPTAGLLHHRHASHLLRFAKPGEEIYKAFESAVGVRGESVLFFDDVEENITAAKRLGWRAVKIDHTKDTPPQVEAGLRAHGITC